MPRFGRAYPIHPLIRKNTRFLWPAPIVWGHITGVLEQTIRTLINNWTGPGTVENTGDLERIVLAAAQTMTSEVVITGALTVTILYNVYRAGDTITLEYRHGATEADCLAASWTVYAGAFASLGYVQVRVTHT